MSSTPKLLETVTTSPVYMPSLQFLKKIHSVVTCWRLSGLDMQLEGSNNKPVITCKELGILKNTAVLEDPPMSTNKEHGTFISSQPLYIL